MRIIIQCDTPTTLTSERPAIDAAITRLQHFTMPDEPGGTEQTHAVLAQQRDKNGWLEFQLVTHCDDQARFQRGKSMLIGMIQRSVGAGFEFHS